MNYERYILLTEYQYYKPFYKDQIQEDGEEESTEEPLDGEDDLDIDADLEDSEAPEEDISGDEMEDSDEELGDVDMGDEDIEASQDDLEVVDNPDKSIELDVTDLVTMNQELQTKIDDLANTVSQIMSSELPQQLQGLSDEFKDGMNVINQKIEDSRQDMEREFKKRVPTNYEKVAGKTDKTYSVPLTDYFKGSETDNEDGQYLTLDDIKDYNEIFIKNSLA